MRWYATLINQSGQRMTSPQACLSFRLTYVTHYLFFFISTLQKIIVMSLLYHKNRNNSNFQNILSYALFLTIARYFQKHFDLFLTKEKGLGLFPLHYLGSIISVVGKTTVEITELFKCTQKVP